MWTAPATSRYKFSTAGSDFDTVLYLLRGSCSGDEIACNDDAVGLQSEVVVGLSAGEVVTVVIDGYGTGSGDYELAITQSEVCDDRIDNNSNGLLDCRDPVCAGVAAYSSVNCCHEPNRDCPRPPKNGYRVCTLYFCDFRCNPEI